MASTLTEANLKKLTVPQLKLMCKERRVVGYSKLAKDGIIAKFLNWQKTAGTSTVCSQASQSLSAVKTQDVLSVNLAQATEAMPNLKVDSIRGLALENVESSTLQKTINTGTRSSDANSDNTSTPTILMNRDDSLPKRPRPETSSSQNHSKKAKSNDSQTAQPRNNVFRPTISTAVTGGSRNCEKEKAGVCDFTEPEKWRENEPQVLSKTAAKRFKALIPKSHADSNAAVSHINSTGATSTSTTITKHGADVHYLDYDQRRHLNFPTEQPILLSAISFPPTVSQRKHVPRLSLILSGLSFEDLKSCALVSRAFRYSAYLSAFYQLSRRFQGKRLQDILHRYSSKMVNLWPYLRLRDREVDIRRGTYEKSFLADALRGISEIDETLWSSPNHDKQITIALRFLTTKLFFLVSVGHCGEEYRHTGKVGRVTDAQEVVENEIWKVTYRSPSSVQTFYILEATCEVIGESAISDTPLVTQTNLRADWAAYIESVTSKADADEHVGLSKRLQWSNHEEYERGISKVWLKRIGGEGEVGSEKLKIATRYVFACVIGNSISGPWRTANEMAQEFDGRSSMQTTRNHQSQKLCLFLPTHHHVESVHFTSSNGRPLHPALAVVQTPGREYFILKDNGMQVGCEEEGIGLIWTELLGCAANGCHKL